MRRTYEIREEMPRGVLETRRTLVKPSVSAIGLLNAGRLCRTFLSVHNIANIMYLVCRMCPNMVVPVVHFLVCVHLQAQMLHCRFIT